MGAVISSASLSEVWVPINDLFGTDPTSFVVEMAFTTGAEPAGPDWKDAEWRTLTNPTRHFAACLVGPSGAATLTDGTWVTWVRITAGLEVPVLRAPEPTIVT